MNNKVMNFLAGTCCFCLLFILSIILTVVLGVGIIIWWIADLAIFAKNDRLSGNGCILRPNL